MVKEEGDAPRRYPYDPLKDLYDEAHYLLKVSKQSKGDELPHIPTFARRMLEHLRDIGLLHVRDSDLVNVRKVKLDERQEVWVRYDTYRDDEGYTAVDVVDAPRSDGAILAAMVAWLAQPIDFDRLLDAQRFVRSEAFEVQRQEINAVMDRIVKGGQAESIEFEEAVRLYKLANDIQTAYEPLKALNYLLPLIEHYRPEVSDYSPQEAEDLLEKASTYISDFLESLRKLQAFLEYGAPNRKLLPAAKEPKRDVKAAILHDVDGLNYRQIGERMEISLPPAFEIKGEHQTVRKMVDRGRRILQEAFGKEGWQKRIKVMKAEKAWWKSLSTEEQRKEFEIESTAHTLGISIEEA